MPQAIPYALVVLFALSALAGAGAIAGHFLGWVKPPASSLTLSVWLLELPVHAAAAVGLLLGRPWGWLAAVVSVAGFWVVAAGSLLVVGELPLGRAISTLGGLGLLCAAVLALLNRETVRTFRMAAPPAWLANANLYPRQLGFAALSLVVVGLLVTTFSTSQG